LKAQEYFKDITLPALIKELTDVERSETTLKGCIVTTVKRLPYVPPALADALDASLLTKVTRTVALKTWTKIITEVPCLKLHFGSIYNTTFAETSDDNSRATY